MLQNTLCVANSLWYHALGAYSLSRVSKTNNLPLKYSIFFHSLTCFINGFVAFLVLLDMHVVQLHGRPIYYLRYVEWTLCTPLLTYEICQVASMDICETVTIVWLTIAFCFCGSIAAFTNLFWAKIILGLKGSLYASFVIYKLIKVLYQKQSKVSHINIIMTIIVWPLYVATWGMGPDVFHVISGRREWIIQSIFSILLKTISVSYAFLTYEEVDIENAFNATMELMQYIFR